MAENDGNVTVADPTANGVDNEPQVGVISQYIKDMSIENPNAPDVYQWEDQGQIDVQVNIGANTVADDVYEVELKLEAKGEGNKGVSFQIELVYCGLFGLRNVPEDQLQPFLFAEAPRIIFPFARRILADAVRDAGFPPLMLEPMDFTALYMHQRAQADAEAAAAGEGQPVGNA